MSDAPNKQQAIVAIDTLVRYIESANGELREGLARTPQRVIESFEEIYSGYSGNSELILDAIDEMHGRIRRKPDE